MSDRSQPNRYIHFDEDRCLGCGNCIKVCPTTAIRLREGKSFRLVDQCIGCAQCIRECPVGAVGTPSSAFTTPPPEEPLPVALVSPVLYCQFPGILPESILHALKRLGFRHVFDLSYFLELYQYAADMFIITNRVEQRVEWPVISSFCPVVMGLIAARFPNLLPNVLPVKRPVALAIPAIQKYLAAEHAVNPDRIALYHITPCLPKIVSDYLSFQEEGLALYQTLGIRDVYAPLISQLKRIRRGDVKAERTQKAAQGKISALGLKWAASGGEIEDMRTVRTLAVSGLQETRAYLEKIEMGLFRDIEYMEFRGCPEGCIGGAMVAIDKYLAKSALNRALRLARHRRLFALHETPELYRRGRLFAQKSPAQLAERYRSARRPLSLNELTRVEKLVQIIDGKNCAACGAPDCRTFAEDVVRREAALGDCILLRAREYNPRGDTGPSSGAGA